MSSIPLCARPSCQHAGTLHVEGKCEGAAADGGLCGCTELVA